MHDQSGSMLAFIRSEAFGNTAFLGFGFIPGVATALVAYWLLTPYECKGPLAPRMLGSDGLRPEPRMNECIDRAGTSLGGTVGYLPDTLNGVGSLALGALLWSLTVAAAGAVAFLLDEWSQRRVPFPAPPSAPEGMTRSSDPARRPATPQPPEPVDSSMLPSIPLDPVPVRRVTNAPPAWDPGGRYVGGAVVQYGQSLYAVRPGRSSAPGIAPPNDDVTWQFVGRPPRHEQDTD